MHALDVHAEKLTLDDYNSSFIVIQLQSTCTYEHDIILIIILCMTIGSLLLTLGTVM